MKEQELLALMGELDESYIEDAAEHLERSPRRFWARISRPAAAAAVIGVISLSAATIVGVIRDGIAQQTSPAGYTETTTSVSGTEAAFSQTATAQQAETICTLPTDLFMEMTDTTATTTVTTTTTAPAVTLTVPADCEMPDASLVQGIKDRFLVNWMSQSGALAVTVEEANYYSSLEDAGLTVDDLMQPFIDNQWYSLSYPTADEAYYERGNDWHNDSVKRAMQDYNFVKLTVTVENINAVSDMVIANGYRLPDGTILEDFAQIDDFDCQGFSFFIPYNRDSLTKGTVTAGPAYFSLEGQLYDDESRRNWFRVPQGESVTFEIGGFLPKTNADTLSSLGYDEDDSLVQYYCFGAVLSRPHVALRFTE